MDNEAEIETMAEKIYTDLYGAIGGRWELVETKDVWREKARAALKSAEREVNQ